LELIRGRPEYRVIRGVLGEDLVLVEEVGMLEILLLSCL
jgi:uncharacterized protein (UPF0216 family)